MDSPTPVFHTSQNPQHHHNHHHHQQQHQRQQEQSTSPLNYNFSLSATSDTNFNFINASEEEVDHFNNALKHFITPALFYSITLLGITGNSLVIYVILSNQKMRTVINLLLLNLAIADLSFVSVVPPSTSYYLAKEHWPFGNAACKIMHYLVNVTAYITVYTLVLISVIRFLTVVRGLNTTAWKTKKMVMTSVIGMWLLTSLLNMPILFKYKLFSSDRGILECDYEDPDDGRKIFTTFFVFAYLLPLACIGLLSVGILRHIEKNKPTCGPMLANHRKTRSGIKKRQASRLLILVVLMFAISWLPIQFHLLFGAHFGVPDSNFYATIHCIFCLLAYSNSCVNPIIYNHTSRDFREAFKSAVTRCCRCCLPLRKPCNKEITAFSAAETARPTKRKEYEMSKMAVPEVDVGDRDGARHGGSEARGLVDAAVLGKVEVEVEAECNDVPRNESGGGGGGGTDDDDDHHGGCDRAGDDHDDHGGAGDGGGGGGGDDDDDDAVVDRQM